MTVDEVAAYARKARLTVLRAIYAHRLQSSQTSPGAHHRIHRDDVDAWMSGRKPTVNRRGPRPALQPARRAAA